MAEKLTYSVAEAAGVLGVRKPTVYNLIHKEDFPAFKVGGRTLISIDGLRRWVATQAGGTEGGTKDG